MNNTDKIREVLSRIDRAEAQERYEAGIQLEMAKKRRDAAIASRVDAYNAAAKTLHAVYGGKEKKIVHNGRIFSYELRQITSGEVQPEIIVEGEAIVLDGDDKEKKKHE